MTEKEIVSKSLFEKIHDRLSAMYDKKIVHDKISYELPDGEIIRLCRFISFDAFVIEYADDMDEAEKNWFEDGKVFYPEDYQDEEKMIEDIIAEIERGIK